MGANAMIAANTVIMANNHRYDSLGKPINQQGLRSVGITIEDDVWIGANCCVLDGCRVSTSSIANAGSVVSGKIDPLEIVAGNPAKPVFERR